ncbi:bifunctional alpha,alpha-trehalose-phosphate synthase (UDP-forming)/trehalose-phosphatase [bacterium]|nr:bifunctional alpha,alpha-trehalose-phosphate synthase (UDP-forming)/trehalose-phosphatase [bacterium]
MSRILIVSNRLPISTIRRGRTIKFKPSVGGLATGLKSIMGKFEEHLWIGWPGIVLDNSAENDRTKIISHLAQENCCPVFLTHAEVKDYYEGFCNKTIWPLFHYFIQYTRYDVNLWNTYVRVNELFCETVMAVARPDDVIWIHDYHLLLLPKMIRERLPGAAIGFFLHIPFPSFEVFRLLPWRREILEGMLGADLVGFHTYDYVRHFLNSIRSRLSCEISFGQITIGKRIVKTDTFPMGIDYERFAQAARIPAVKEKIENIRERVKGRKIIISVDRLDYTKGILHRLESFDLFLDKYSEYRGKVTLILVAVPSREGIEHYEKLKRQLDELIGRINGKYGTFEWMPLWYLYNFLDFPELAALYHAADVALVTPLRDGMNLIAKEFIASRHGTGGVLILSEMAGAAKELREAIVVNPNNADRIADALHRALTMSKREQIARNREMQKRLRQYSVQRWAECFIRELTVFKEQQRTVFSRKLSTDIQNVLLHDYHTGTRRLLLLDYDGTLRPFESRPQQAKPDKELMEILAGLSRHTGNDVLIISGRDKETLDTWFGGIALGMVAEHGVWIKEHDGEWEMIEYLRNNWKSEIRPLLELYIDRTPGSHIEEKEFSLVWHYRNADPALASMIALELKDALINLTINLGLEVLEGSKVIEIKNREINKGRAALRWISRGNYDFILAAGDDLTDESIFNVLDRKAYSIKVGFGFTNARYILDSSKEVRELLKSLVKKDI